jgi:cytochrome c biogenesis protein CcdA
VLDFDLGSLGVAFGAGLLAALNPCGFAMLPAYLAYFTGTEGVGEAAAPMARPIGRAIRVSAAMTAGFVTVFASFGLVISPLIASVERALPWLTIVIGVGLVGLGAAMAGGREVSVRLPKLGRRIDGDGIGAVFLFGVTYAVASLSCTIGPFLAVTSTTLGSSGWFGGVVRFVVYGLGMGALVSVLTITVAVSSRALSLKLRRVLPYLGRISGGLVVLAGLYVAWYGWYEIRLLRGSVSSDPIIDAALDVQSWLQGLVPSNTTMLTIVGVLALVLGARAVLRRAKRSTVEAPEISKDGKAAS